ncbi:MAG: S1 RNA-binding domain-containing protein [Myxococcota bacterium]|nr:S1 RNA-binding domain-containing protein [Myxococcota bacterium]
MHMKSQPPHPGSNEDAQSDDAAFEALLEASSTPQSTIAKGDKIEASVISIGRDYVFLDLGARTEGLLHRGDVETGDGEDTPLAPGDQITVFVTAFRDGAILCGRRMGLASSDRLEDKTALMSALKDAFDAGMPVEGVIKESIKGGFSISLMGQRAFCPISQIDDKYCDTPDAFINQTLLFVITKFEESGRNIVVSRRKVLEAEAAEKARALWLEIEVGKTYDGVVSSIQGYGAFVDIGGIQGLLHVSEISYDRVSDPKDLLDVGQQITVAIKAIDREAGRVSLSLKALMTDPWEEAIAVLRSGQVVKGRVSRLAQFGAFVALTPGVEGLVHISQMDATKRIHSPREVVALNQEVTVRILEIDPDQKRISLTMNTEDAEEDWKENQNKGRSTGSMGTLGDLFQKK